MALGNEARTEPRIAKLEISEQPGCDDNGGRWRAEAASAAVADPAQARPTAEALIAQAELPKGVDESGAVARVKQARENDLFHIFDLEDRSERSA